MKLITNLAIALITLGLPIAAWSIPAKIGTQTLQQPDGTTINVRMTGNGNLHFVTTEDGRLLTQDENGFYTFARINEKGLIESLGIKPGETLKNPQSATKVGDPEFNQFVTTRSEELEEKEGPLQWGMGKYSDKYPTQGNPRVPIFLVEFEEQKFGDFYDPKEYFDKLANGDGTEEGDNASIRKYFEDQSRGKFSPRFDIYGPITLPREMSYYGGNYGQGWDVCAHYMVSHAATILDDEVDFSPYDEDGDGNIDFVYVIYAGYGEHRQGGEDTIWPHAGDLYRQADFKKCDGLWFKKYACSNELIEENLPEGICTIVHEYSHIIGLPDVYTVDMVIDPRDFTPGQYSIMDYGVYNNDGLTPPNYSAYELNALQWEEPIVLDKPMSVTLEEIGVGKYCLIKTPEEKEFFLVENRQPVGRDAYLPGHGMLIWHIDYQENMFTNNIINFDPSHLLVDVVRANNETSFAKMAEGFTFPGTTGKTAFTAETDPAMVTWKGKAVDVPITNIEEKDGLILFDVMGGGAGISSIAPDFDGRYMVYNSHGVKVLDTDDESRIMALPKGLYIINGKKILK